MNRNSKSHFSATDNRINIGRSRFDRPSWFKTTAATGSLGVFYCDEVLPGDTFDMKTSVLCRMATPIFPVADNCYLDTYFFFIPNRLVWNHWAQFNGENDVNAWEQTIEYEIPQIPLMTSPEFYEFSLYDYFGLPKQQIDTQKTETVSALPFRAYQLVWNEWFRDQNLQDPVFVPKDDDFEMLDFDNAFNVSRIRKACKFHDYFSSALPSPQKSSSVLIPGFDGSVPVVTGKNHASQLFADNYGPYSLMWRNVNDGSVVAGSSQLVTGGSSMTGVKVTGSDVPTSLITPSNLWVGSTNGVTIDALRTAFQIQKLLWRDGIGGTRYTEIIRSHFGVVSPDGRMQRPEYLGGKRIPITMNQVIQQSAASGEPTPLGNAAGISKTVDSFNGFTKSFTEHGWILGLFCLRTDHTYQQGINRMWSRKQRFDFYFPELANIGEMPILNKEIFFDGSGSDANDEVFGYQEAWAEYRYRPSYVSGAFRSDYSGGSLDSWHYADFYESLPHLSDEWIEETSENVKRTLAVTENPNEQWLLDFYFDLKTTRPMPTYSVPGLVDHF